MSTDKQVAANRRNAQLSTGPKTPEGKETSKWNTLRHGCGRKRRCSRVKIRRPTTASAKPWFVVLWSYR